MEQEKPNQKCSRSYSREQKLVMALGATVLAITLSILATGWAECGGIAVGSIFIGMALVLAGWQNGCVICAGINKTFQRLKVKGPSQQIKPE